MRKSRVLLFVLLSAVLVFSLSQSDAVPHVWGDVSFGVTATPSIRESPNYLLLNKATLSVSGTLTGISFYCLALGANVKVGIYADSSGSPGSLLVGPITQNSCASGWNTVSASASLAAGDYWLAGSTDTNGGLGEVSGDTGTMWYKAFSFTSSWPNPAGGGYTSYSRRNAIYATVTTGPSSYNFNVRTGATQVVVTVSWTGTLGTASVSIAGPGGTPTLSESGAVVYDRASYVSGSSTPTNIHRVTFTVTGQPTGTWTAYVSQTGAAVTIEVS